MTTTTSALENEVVDLLRARRAGDPAAGRRLFEILYGDLRSLARRRLAAERADHTLQPTSLVHEVFVRLERIAMDCEDRCDYLGLAATVMKRILVDHARRRLHREALTEESHDAIEPGGEVQARRILALECALERLELVDPGLARVVELRFLLGMEVDAVARQLDLSVSSVQRDWRTARAFLKRAIDSEGGNGR